MSHVFSPKQNLTVLLDSMTGNPVKLGKNLGKFSWNGRLQLDLWQFTRADFHLPISSICDWSLTWDIWIKTGSTSYMYRWQEDEANKWFLICVCIVRNLSLLKSDTLLENFFGWINAVFLWKIQEKLVDFFYSWVSKTVFWAITNHANEILFKTKFNVLDDNQPTDQWTTFTCRNLQNMLNFSPLYKHPSPSYWKWN